MHFEFEKTGCVQFAAPRSKAGRDKGLPLMVGGMPVTPQSTPPLPGCAPWMTDLTGRHILRRLWQAVSSGLMHYSGLEESHEGCQLSSLGYFTIPVLSQVICMLLMSS